MTIRTNPPGAMVYVDRQLIGPSPASTSFTYYGTRHIEVVADGYRTEKVLKTIHPPWYQIPPLDFISETLWPQEIRDERIVDITLIPEQPLASEQLQARANSLRAQASMGMATPIGGVDASGGMPSPIFPPEDTYDNPQLGPGGSTVPGGVAVPPSSPVLPPLSGNGGPLNPAPVNPPTVSNGPSINDLLTPGGQLPQRIPQASPPTGGGYRPPIDNE